MKYHDVMPPVPPNPSLQATPVPASVALPPPTVAHRWRSALHDGAWNVGGCLGSLDVLLWSASEASSMAAVVCHYPRGGGGTDHEVSSYLCRRERRVALRRYRHPACTHEALSRCPSYQFVGVVHGHGCPVRVGTRGDVCGGLAHDASAATSRLADRMGGM
jgi:hypothetical protein